MHTSAPARKHTPGTRIARAVNASLEEYYATLGAEPARGVYDMVICAAEKPLLTAILARCHGNQSHAAQALGIDRNTLRKLIRKHAIPVPERIVSLAPGAGFQRGPFSFEAEGNP